MTWLEDVKKDMKILDLHEKVTLDRRVWRRIFVVDHME